MLCRAEVSAAALFFSIVVDADHWQRRKRKHSNERAEIFLVDDIGRFALWLSAEANAQMSHGRQRWLSEKLYEHTDEGQGRRNRCGNPSLAYVFLT